MILIYERAQDNGDSRNF